MKILFVAYNFPPCGGPGVQRSIKFIKYLFKKGHRPVVITTFEDAYAVKDMSLLTEIPEGLPVYRAKSIDVNRYRSKFAKFGLGKVHGLINTMMAIPDSAVFWSVYARSVVRKAVAKHQPDIVYTTSGPFSAHLLGLWIKKKYKLPWVADFRDPWSKNRFVRYLPGYRKLNAFLENKVLKQADHILSVSELDAVNFATLAPHGVQITVIHNGFDKDNFPNFGTSVQPSTDKFRITYTGNFSSTRKPDKIVVAVKQLIEENKIDGNAIELVFAGSDLDRFLPGESFIQKLGYVPHSQLSALREKANMMLLLQDTSPETNGDYSGKIFEYLASGKPILAISNPASVAVKLIRETNTGYTVIDSVEAIMNIIEECYLKWETGSFVLDPNWPVIMTYSREAATDKLIGVFNKLLINHNP